MSANVESCFYYGETPWHGLGTELAAPATAAEAISAAKLDWKVECHPLHTELPVVEGVRKHPKRVSIPEKYCTIRTDKAVPLGIVGRLYTPIQNAQAFSFFDSVVGEGLAMYHVAGSLGVGETIWILAKLPSDIRIVGTDDITHKYLLLTNKHDGTMSLRMFFTPIRVVCQNTLSAALSVRKTGEGITLRHFPDIHKKIDLARKTLGMAISYYDELSEAFNALARFEVTETWLTEYIDTVMPTPPNREPSTRLLNIRNGMHGCFESESNLLPGIRGTAWAAYNAVTEFVDHRRKVPKMEVDRTRRLESIWLGSGAVIKERALNVALNRSGYNTLTAPATPKI